jgi:hypothetical protein
MLRKVYKYVTLTVAVFAAGMIVPFSVLAVARTCRRCSNAVYTGSNYCINHLCYYPECKRPIYADGYDACLYHTCREKGCKNVVMDESGAKACIEHYEKYKDLAGKGGKIVRISAETTSAKKNSNTSSSSSTKSSSKKSSGTKTTTSSSKAKRCKYSGCKNWGVTYKKGYCNKHYDQLYGKRDDYYDEDPESYYQDNKSQYRSRSEAYDDWEDEYEED